VNGWPRSLIDLVEVNGGLVFSVEVDGELASRMTNSNTRPAPAGEKRDA